jgi:hypothetical protein
MLGRRVGPGPGLKPNDDVNRRYAASATRSGCLTGHGRLADKRDRKAVTEAGR